MTPARPRAEPMINAPAGVLAIVGLILGSYLLESLSPDPRRVEALLGLDPSTVMARPWTLLTVLLAHASWAHAGLNALGALAFGTPVARVFGRGRSGRFLGFYALCGLLASLGYLLLHWGRPELLVGASGAVSGLMGATSRLIERRPGGALAPFASRTVIGMAGAWIGINLLMALGWIDAGAGGAPIAWEAHLVGYAAGLLLIAPCLGRSARVSGGIAV